MNITDRHSGAFFPVISMDGKAEPITDVLNANLIALSGVVDQLAIERRAVGINHLSPIDNSFFIASATDLQKNPIYVPTLAELGFTNGGYTIKASIGVTTYDPTNGVPEIELRLLNAADESVVNGFLVRKILIGAGSDEFVKTAFANLTPGQSYYVDFRTEIGKQARVRVYTIHLQIIKL
ncbi:MAG: hypothetical protein AAF242_02740 [Bacteroidota bacterium]